MVDKLKHSLVNISFVEGEKAEYDKLTAAYSRLKAAVEFIDKAIGDLYTQEIQQTAAGTTYQLSTLPTAGSNLTRIVGSSGWLNPRHIGRIRLTNQTVIIAGHMSVDTDPPTKDGFNHYNRTQFRLPFPPIQFTNTATDETVTYQTSWDAGNWTIGSPGGAYTDVSSTYTTRVANISDLNADNEYQVSNDGLITLWRPLDNNEAFEITYTCDTIWDSYDGSTLNVIPDFSQTTTLCAVTSAGSGEYDITLPTVTNRRGRNISSASATLFPWTIYTTDNNDSITDPMGNYQAVLPLSLTGNLSSGDTIPEGSIYLWDSFTSQVLAEGAYEYRATNQVRVSGLVLTTGSNRYRLVVPGTNLAATVSQMRENLYWQDHSGRLLSDGTYLGNRISHADLLNLIDEGNGTAPTYYPSTLGPTRNPHPEYLHRNGDYTDGGAAAGNYNNAMRGTLGLDDSIIKVINTTTTTNPAITTTPSINTLYAKNIVKAWGASLGNNNLRDGFNVSISSGQVTFRTPMENNDYVVIISGQAPAGNDERFYTKDHTVNGFTIAENDWNGNNSALNNDIGFIVVGEQST
jgi:hypothetical protein